MNIRDVLERKLGKLSDQAFDFAIEQFERNSELVKKERKMSTAQAMDEISTNIDFFNRQIARR